MRHDKRKSYGGATFLEYALLFATAVLALIAVSVVLQRGVSGNWKQAADVFGHGRIYNESQ